jgi:hypothetical protein
MKRAGIARQLQTENKLFSNYGDEVDILEESSEYFFVKKADGQGCKGYV